MQGFYCIPLINLLRPNIFKGTPKDQRFSLILEVLFLLIYPRHHLIGLNHQALVDYQQTRLVCKSFDELCKPIGERGEKWQPETVARASQTSNLNWLRGEETDGSGEMPHHVNMIPTNMINRLEKVET